MKISVEMNDETVRRAASIVMKHYKDKEFCDRLSNVSQFNHTHLPSHVVAGHLYGTADGLEIKIVSFKSVNPWSRSVGCAKGNTIFVNTRKNLDLISRVENIYHEAAHLMGFSHKGNYVTAYNLKTVPYLASAIFAKYVSEIYGE